MRKLGSDLSSMTKLWTVLLPHLLLYPSFDQTLGSSTQGSICLGLLGKKVQNGPGGRCLTPIPHILSHVQVFLTHQWPKEVQLLDFSQTAVKSWVQNICHSPVWFPLALAFLPHPPLPCYFSWGEFCPAFPRQSYYVHQKPTTRKTQPPTSYLSRLHSCPHWLQDFLKVVINFDNPFVHSAITLEGAFLPSPIPPKACIKDVV